MDGSVSQTELVHNLEFLLDLQLLLEEQVAAMTKRALAQTRLLHQLHIFLDWGTPLP